MPDIPDKVIEQATRAAFMAGDDQEQYVHGFAPDDFEPWRWSSGELMVQSEATVAAAAPVIAAWAREQERDRIVEARREAEQAMIAAPDDHAYTYWEGQVHALAALDREEDQ